MDKPGSSPTDIPVEEAQRLVLSSVRPLPAVEVALHDAAGRFLVGDIVAPRSSPPLDNSAMDGFAIAHPGSEGEGRFAVVGLATAGGPWRGTLAPGQAVKIMTGALIPAGADTVVMKEVCAEDAGAVAVSELPPKGLNVRRAGEDIRAGETALGAGARIGPIEIAALASMGLSRVRVRPRPVVAILSTGSELVALGEPAPEDRIYDSNAHALAALVAGLGATPLRLGIARDTPGAVGEIVRAAPPHDALLTTGGVSVGELDFVKESLRALGCRDLFWRVQMRPGRPAFCGTIGDRPVFGLPGNAVSCMVTFWILAAPALRAMAGDPDPIPAPRRATLLARIAKKRGVVMYARARVSWEEGRLVAAPVKGQMSHQVFGQRGANALVVAPIDREAVEAGETVSVIPFCAPGWTADI